MPILVRPMAFSAVGRNQRRSDDNAPTAPVIWDSPVNSNELALTDTFQTVQLGGGGDMVIELEPGLQAHVQVVYNQIESPTEQMEWHALTSLDGSTWDTINFEGGAIDPTPDPSVVSAIIAGVRYFRIEAALVDLNGTAGGDDVGATLQVVVTVEQDNII